jgi:shikimate kinase
MKSIVLIGPYGVGKSTVGQLLAAARQQSQFSLDHNVWKYYSETGLTLEAAEKLGDFDSLHWQPYHAHAVRRFFEDHEKEVCIMDLGAGHALYEGQYLQEMHILFSKHDTILLIPSPDIAVALSDLSQRNDSHFYKRTQPHTRWNSFFLRHPSGYQLAKYAIHTKDKTPMETCQDILAVVEP